jgi:hypothetical protein
MDENNVMKPYTENSNSSHMSSTSDATSSSVKNVDPFTFVEMQCEVEVLFIYSLYLTKLLCMQNCN